ncbi:hypothetical protein JW968_01845 [Candidatus Woesearchaeota archaeon]|nr:hypothetical protein [Candidatus Woesearchaeota archaeon]
MNITDPLTLVTPFENLYNSLKVLAGGIFGLYLIMIILKWYEARVLRVQIKELRKEMKSLRNSMQVMELKILKAMNPKSRKK